LWLLAKRDSGRPALCGALWMSGGAAIGALPFLAILARERALGAFFRVSFREIPALVSQLLLAAAVTLLLFRAGSGPLMSTDRAAAVAVAFSAVALRGMLGRADAGHSSLYGVFVALPAAWLLYRARRRPLVAAILLLGLSARLHPRATLLL